MEAIRSDEERAYYDLNARVYAWFARYYDLVTVPLRRLRHEVVRAAHAGRSSRVLDVATGTGAQASAFAEVAREVVGVDLSPAMLSVARRKRHHPNLTLLRADATSLPFPEGDFDVSCVSFALHEMPVSIRETVIREMVRVTVPGGTIVVVDYGLPRNAGASFLVRHAVALYERDHYAEFIGSDLRALLEKAGVSIEEERRRVVGIARIVVGSRRA